jgi:hypothetical protein
LVSSAPLLGTLEPSFWHSRPKRHNARPCPRCGLPILFVSGRKGGTYSAAADGSYRRHSCPKAVPTQRLRLAGSAWRRECFTATIKAKRKVGHNQRLEITGLSEGAPFPVEVLNGLRVDALEPAMCRWSKTDPGILEMRYLDHESGDLSGTVILARRLN